MSIWCNTTVRICLELSKVYQIVKQEKQKQVLLAVQVGPGKETIAVRCSIQPPNRLQKKQTKDNIDDPENKTTKVDSKDRLLGEILGYDPQTHISIEYIKSLGDWKTAWDHIHFQGFLGTPMVMQFTWQGCDSILASPLVLDLMRLTERAMRAKQAGVLSSLACFFKSPMAVQENNFVHQFSMLENWITEIFE